ncbi:PepSY domain-containing protein [Sphingomonas gilva]|uniref:PepSY domain-containing protein n=1 Tax=Sphingomonas gilva TaxID=2305907 RepID=A0A396S628_9SPHN|nr:PepSY-associated TM helix domain-containing protein [Sphingomonas gilva]RHW18865.1 PepSY domain-containing protein [Sphingomonas gilva]
MAVTKIGLRDAWFQLHKWIGLILAIAIIPISITGAALVWHDALDDWLNPARVVEGSATLPAAAYVSAAANALAPGERLMSLRIPEEGAVVASAARAPQEGGGRPVRTNIWIDPATARVLDRAGSNEGAVRVMHVLHGSLYIPGWGRPIVGWVGVAMLLSSITGLWLWWPTVGSWVKGLRWRRHNNLDTNLHHLMGFWIAIPLFVLSLTGVWISFPSAFAVFNGAQAQAPREAGPSRQQRMRAQPLAAPATSLDAALSAATAAAPGTVSQIAWPTDVEPDWKISVRPAKGRPAQVGIADATGAASIAPPEPREGETTARLMRRIHDGTDMGIVWQMIIFLGGLLPAILSITGLIMWWRARSWKTRLKQRRARRLQPAE